MSRNCWEVMGCEKHPGGIRVDERGPCPASRIFIASGINNGDFGGRACWAIKNTYCTEHHDVDASSHLEQCMNCKFYHQVAEEEGENFRDVEQIRQELEGFQVY